MLSQSLIPLCCSSAQDHPPPRPCVSPGVGLPLTEDQDPGVAGEGCI